MRNLPRDWVVALFLREMIAMVACMMIVSDLARLIAHARLEDSQPIADSSTPETENLDKATEAMIAMIIAVETRAHLLIGVDTHTETVTVRVIEARAAIQAEVAALVEVSPIWGR